MKDNNIEKTLSCDGTDNCANSELSKHPLVYFKVVGGNKVICPYCGKDFTKHNKINIS